MNKRRINESSMLIDEFSISDNEKLKVYWDKNDGYVVEKIYNQGNDLWRTDFKKTFHDELSAKRYFSKAKKKFVVNESDKLDESNKHEILKEIGKFQLVKKGSGKYNAGYEVRENGKRIHGLYTSSDSEAIEHFDDFISHYNKKFGENGGLEESVEDKKIHKFEITDDYFDNIYNLFYEADEYFKNNPHEDRFEFEFDKEEFKKKFPKLFDSELESVAIMYYNDMVDISRNSFLTYSMDIRNKKYYDPDATAFDKIIAVVRDKDYEDESDRLDESKSTLTLDSSVYDWYSKRNPTDYQLDNIDREVTFRDVLSFHEKGGDVGDVLLRAVPGWIDSAVVEVIINKAIDLSECVNEAFGQQEMTPNFDMSLLDKWVSDLTEHEKSKYENHPEFADTYDYTIGGKYIKVFMGNERGHRSVFAFIDADGNIYKPAGWNAPAKGVRARIDDNPPLDGYELYSKKYRGIKEDIYDEASYNWLSEVIDRDVKFHYISGGYGMQFESEKDYKKAKEIANKHHHITGNWFDEDLQFWDSGSTTVGDYNLW